MRVLGVVAAVVLLAGCQKGATSLLLHITGPKTTNNLDVTITVGEKTVHQNVPIDVAAHPLPGEIVVELPDVARQVTIDLIATTTDGLTIPKHIIANAKAHTQVDVTIDLLGGDPDLGTTADAAGPDLGGADLTTSAPDQGTPSLNARVIANAYWTDYGGNTYSSSGGMSKTGFEVPTTGVVNGDLLLFIANIDNGSNSLWPVPIATGFTELTQHFFGSDGQTFTVSWKIANNEPSKYTGTYGPGIASGSSTITLLAISGAHPTNPIDMFQETYGATSAQNPVIPTSPGVTTTKTNTLLVFAAGADWLNQTGSNTFVLPPGFTQLAAFGDHGNSQWDWTSQMIGTKPMPAAGATGTLSGELDAATINGYPWAVVVAIAPAP